MNEDNWKLLLLTSLTPSDAGDAQAAEAGSKQKQAVNAQNNATRRQNSEFIAFEFVVDLARLKFIVALILTAKSEH